MMELSKAFAYIPHDLVLAKLNAYGFTNAATSLIASYLTNRKQCVKLGDVCSDFVRIVQRCSTRFYTRSCHFKYFHQ